MLMSNTYTVKSLLQNLHDSCREGQYKMWDCSTDSGREGFGHMVEVLEEIARVIGVKLTERYPEKGGTYDDRN
jgi:hypothetical protein